MKSSRYIWHKQALFKGRSPLYGTTWAGWEFWKDHVDDERVKVYTQAQANALTDDELCAAPVFRQNPNEMFSSNIVQSVQDNLLARGIPELSFPIGYTSLSTNNCVINVDMHIDLRRADEAWPERDIDFSDDGQRPKRWLHTDLMNVAYYYTYKLYKEIH
jgi:hypothetical protein